MNISKLATPRVDRVDVPRSARVWSTLTLGGRLGRGTAIVLWIAAVAALSLFLGWGWLAAAGVASVVLGLVPCLAVCALGLCAGSQKNCADRKAGSGSQTRKPGSPGNSARTAEQTQ